MRCLIVEPDTTLCAALSDSIHDLGHSAVCTASVVEAERRLRLVDFDVLMLDHDLPDAQTQRLIRLYRSLRPAAHVLRLTGCEVFTDGSGARLAPHIVHLLAGQNKRSAPPNRPGPLAAAMAWLS